MLDNYGYFHLLSALHEGFLTVVRVKELLSNSMLSGWKDTVQEAFLLHYTVQEAFLLHFSTCSVPLKGCPPTLDGNHAMGRY